MDIEIENVIQIKILKKYISTCVKHSYAKDVHAHTRTHARTQARARARTHTHTHLVTYTHTILLTPQFLKHFTMSNLIWFTSS